MKDAAIALYNKKNEWLASQVDVEFPTPESLKGRALYLDSLTSRYLESVPNSEMQKVNIEWHLVDFHRLTVMFALMQSKQWGTEEGQNLIVEFLTQIILEPDYGLYVGFEDGQPTCAALLSQDDNVMLVSDVISSDTAVDYDRIALSLIQSLESSNLSEVWIEKR
ncbi:hypothetical protein BCU70_03050 [Vibrio sp. 10N.286.49.C2]|uniref:flavodoxin n=1 Tax=unclassified Vibrio TaxID=2614977 RepID=UPI000C838E22|nr:MULTISPECIES: flavodoxin [unclassified Vibrio]PMH38266.1 hypothetical protein BCU70_03050 [Vibrio sp. 10N.286.49.C2]PMH55674.1 hypothetical protein BCU66_08645 [Vibrio sp. 10N.286.49.B1]PMH83936.1 hypothetical protein BCU58_12930 [Vibrio sp. 10N.286.48.B7]